jgi:hypothetical protein
MGSAKLKVFQMQNVVNLPTKSIPATKVKVSRAAVRAMRRQVVIAGIIGGVAVALTALSLHHLATGVELVTHTSAWQAWAMAIGIDVGFIASELAQLVIGAKLQKQIAIYLKSTIFGTLLASAAGNVGANVMYATGWLVAPAVLFGLGVPVLIYLLTRIGAALYIDCHARG